MGREFSSFLTCSRGEGTCGKRLRVLCWKGMKYINFIRISGKKSINQSMQSKNRRNRYDDSDHKMAAFDLLRLCSNRRFSYCFGAHLLAPVYTISQIINLGLLLGRKGLFVVMLN